MTDYRYYYTLCQERFALYTVNQGVEMESYLMYAIALAQICLLVVVYLIFKEQEILARKMYVESTSVYFDAKETLKEVKWLRESQRLGNDETMRKIEQVRQHVHEILKHLNPEHPNVSGRVSQEISKMLRGGNQLVDRQMYGDGD